MKCDLPEPCPGCEGDTTTPITLCVKVYLALTKRLEDLETQVNDCLNRLDRKE